MYVCMYVCMYAEYGRYHFIDLLSIYIIGTLRHSKPLLVMEKIILFSKVSRLQPPSTSLLYDHMLPYCTVETMSPSSRVQMNMHMTTFRTFAHM